VVVEAGAYAIERGHQLLGNGVRQRDLKTDLIPDYLADWSLAQRPG
jgi:hypothetical protein